MKIRTLVSAAAAVAASVVIAEHSFGGDLERYCFGIPPAAPTEVIERWTSPANLPWCVCTGPLANFIAPRLPAIACSQALTSDELTHPGIQSIRRAMLAWQNAVTAAPGGPFGGSAALSFSTVPSHMPLPSTPAGVPFFAPQTMITQGPDGLNLITFWEQGTTFLPVGGTFTLAVAAVLPNFPSGAILECDIAAQAATMDPNAPGRPFWAWAESNDLYGKTFAANRVNPATAANLFPTLGYLDMQGVLTHELGHFIGLGHAVIDASYADTISSMPTMFPIADISTFDQTVESDFNAVFMTCTTTPYASDGQFTATGGRFGLDARTLQADDVRAVRAGYPNAGLTPGLGTIQGTVTSAATLSPILGANVVAIRTTDPTIRASTFVYGNGTYQLSNLEPGDYYLYAEPVDQSPPGAAPRGFYFDGAVVPNYVFLPAFVNFPPCTANEFFNTEFFDANEGFGETTPMLVTPLTVVAGGTLTANFSVDASFNTLDLEALLPGQNPVRHSARGTMVTPLSTTYPTVDIRVFGTPGRRVVLVLDTKPSPIVVLNQLWMAQGGSDPAMPIVPVGTIGATGVFTFQFQLTQAMAMRNIFVQAAVGVGNNMRLTNVANIYVNTR